MNLCSPATAKQAALPTPAVPTKRHYRAHNITKAVIEAAKGGDLMAAKIILDRLIPPAKERPENVDLPDTKTAQGAANDKMPFCKLWQVANCCPVKARP